MRLHITVTDTGESLTVDGDSITAHLLDDDAIRRFLGNCLATLDKSAEIVGVHVGPHIVIRWIPDAD